MRMPFISKLIFLLFVSAAIFKRQTLCAQTLHQVTSNGNSTTNPISLGPSSSPYIPPLEILHNGGNSYGTGIQIKTTGGYDGPRLAFERNDGSPYPKRWNIGIREAASTFGIFEDGFTGAFGTERFTILPGGNVGIGTPTPSSKLDIAGGGNATIDLRVNGRIQTGDASGGGGIWLGNDGTGFVGNNGGNIGFWTNGGSWNSFQIQKSNGFVGIGTTGPSQRLTVQGNIAGVDANGGYILLDPNDGGVEIASGNNPHSFIDFKGNGNLNSDMQGRIAYVDGSGFEISTAADYGVKVKIGTNGFVGIGTSNPHEMLSVNGNILARKVKVSIQAGDWSDYVFSKDYKLRSLTSVENFITKYKHLPGIPSAKKVEKGGLDVGGMQGTLLRKIEELTLYVISLNKRIQKLEAKK